MLPLKGRDARARLAMRVVRERLGKLEPPAGFKRR